MEKNILRIFGDIIYFATHQKYSYHLSDAKKLPTALLTHGGMDFKFKTDGEYKESIELLKQFAKDCQQCGLIVEELKGETIREHGYHSGSWDVDAFAMRIRLPLSPAIEVLYGEKETRNVR